MALKIVLNGGRGRMCQAIGRIAQDFNCTITAALERENRSEPHIKEADVIIDFSTAEATLPLARMAKEHHKPLVIGTTGQSPEETEEIRSFAKEIPIVWSGNFSVGINVLYHLTKRATELLGPKYHSEILEIHHAGKRDAPSGTAAHLTDIVRTTRNLPENKIRYGRQGLTGERPEDEIGVHSVRAGDVIGEHTVFFAGPNERLELTHKASDRKIFASGALRAAHWVHTQKPGLYTMADVLNLNS